MIIKNNISLLRLGLYVCIWALFSGFQISAQKPPTAVVQELESGTFVLEAKFPQKVLDVNCRRDLVKCLLVESTVYDGSDAGLLFEDIEGDAVGTKKVPILNIGATENCGRKNHPDKKGNFCLNISEDDFLTVVYRFVEPPVLKNDKYTLNAVIRQNTSSSDVVGGYAASAKLEFELKDSVVAALSDTDRNSNTNLKTMYMGSGQEEIISDNNIIKILIRLPDKAPVTDEDDVKLKQGRILLRRVREILGWLDLQQRNPANIATVTTEVRDGSGEKNFPLSGFAYLGQEKSRNRDASASQICGLEGEVPRELQPLSERELHLYCKSALNLYLVGRQSLPSQPFLFNVTFQQNPPLELSLIAKATPIGSGIKTLAAPDSKSVGENKALGLRSFKSNFDLGLAYTNSVQEVEENNRKMRKRLNNGAIDFMFAPILDKYLTEPKKVQLLTTPFFIDSKASFDKVNKNTLSLNRNLIGSDISILFIGKKTPGDETHPADSDKYKMSFRFINASDRDFKRAEAKFNFETLFYFVALNRPLSQRIKSISPSRLNPKAGPTAVPTGSFGYQVQPILGFDLGRVYREKRTAFSSEEQSRFVRRFYFGLDMKFDLTRRASLTFKDTYYIRGEAPQARYRNYFLGELTTPIGNLSKNTAQSIFFSFERGEQPPFVSPSVNSFKVGYRITANFFDDIPPR